MRRGHRRHHAAAHGDAFASGLLSYAPDDAEGLRRQLVGSVTTPFDGSYTQDRMAFMHTYQQYPQIIVRCATVTDVQAALAFARKHSLKVTTRSGGHSTAGFSVNDQLTIDMGAVNHVELTVRNGRNIARVGAGTPFRKLNQVLDAAGLHVPGGGCETVCVAGYMQGGGYGFTSRLFGMNCDNVRAVTMVLADGRVVRASAKKHTDLFWAVRGGTGNQFGVLFEIEYELHTLGELWGFGLCWPLDTPEQQDSAAEALAVYQSRYTSCPDAPAELGHQVMLVNVPTAENAQSPQILIRGVSTAKEARTRKLLAPLIDTLKDPKRQIDVWQAGRYMELNEALNLSTGPDPQDLPVVSPNTLALADSRIISRMHGAKMWREVIKLFMEAPVRSTFIGLEAYGGAINTPDPSDMAFVHRRDSLDMYCWTFWNMEADEPKARAWLKRFAALGASMGSGRRYANYPLRGTRDFGPATFGDNLRKLVAIKHSVDPDNLFDFEQSLARVPRASTG